MAPPSNPTKVLAERWSTFYRTHRGPYKYPLVNVEEDHNRLRMLRENWLTLLREASAWNSDWPTTKAELDQLMVLLRWDPSKMWKIAKESQIRISAQDKTGNTAQECTTRRSGVPITRSGEDAQINPERGLAREESHPTMTLRPNILPLAYIRTFYNELDEASLITDELKAFAYEQSLKQINIFYGRALNYCKRLQEALQYCQNDAMASKLYNAFERDHQVLANHLNREWIIAVHDKMKELGIAMPEDKDDSDSDENDEGNNLELAAELIGRSSETQSIITDSNATVMENENASQASSSSTERPESIRSTSRSDDKMMHQSESEVETKARHHRPRGSSNEPKQPSAHEEQHHQPKSRRAPNSDNSQRTRLSGPVPEDIRDNRITTGSIRRHDKDSEIRQNLPHNPELGLGTEADYRANHPRLDPSKEGMQVSMSPSQSDHRRLHSSLGAPSRKETNYTERPVKAQLEVRSADIEIRISTPLPYKKIQGSQRYVHRELIFIPEDSPMPEPHIATGDIFRQSGTQNRNVHPDTREDYVAENRETSRTGVALDGVRDPSIPSYLTPSSKQHIPNVPLSRETPTRHVASPVRLQHELGRRPEPEQPDESFPATDTIRNAPSTSNSNSPPSGQRRSHGPGLPSTSARSSNPVPYTEGIPQKKSETLLQNPQLLHEKTTAWHNAEDLPKYPARDDQGRQSLSTSTTAESHDSTQDINWQAVDQMWEDMIESIYTTGEGSREESYSQRIADRNHIATDMGVDDQAIILAEEGDGSLESSDDSDLTDSDDFDEETDDVYNPMHHPSILPIVNNGRTIPSAEEYRSANAVAGDGSSGTRKQSVSWGKATVYSIGPEMIKQRNTATVRRIQPQSALKR